MMKLKKLFVWVLIVVMLFCLAGCQKPVDEQKPVDDRDLSVFELSLSDELKEKAEAAYVKWYEKAYGKTPEIAWVWEDTGTGVIQRFSNNCRYYGTFDGAVVWFSAEDWETPRGFELGGSYFGFGFSSDFHMYKDGEYYPLMLAYNRGMISEEDLAIIAQRHWNCGSGYRNYGQFNDCQIWLADCENGEDAEFELAGSKFKHKTGAVIYVRKNKQNYTLQQAYENGWLTKDDIGAVAKLHNERELTFFELVLSEKVKADIQNALNDWERELYAKHNVNIPLTQLNWGDLQYGPIYYGTFGDCAAWAAIGNATVVSDFTLAGSSFKNSTAASFYICREKKHYTLQEAYEQDLITAEDIAIIAERHVERHEAIYGKG